MNIRGLIPRTVPTKVPDLANILSDEDQLAFALTETWLADHSDAETQILGYAMFRLDRKRQRPGKGRNSGGVSLYVKDDYAVSARQIFDYSCGVIETVAVHIEALNLVLTVVYKQLDN